ncbi:MAG: 2-oxoglutarate and iron-dependent oxygenase domain-containing protein [Actinomycetota bacterium]
MIPVLDARADDFAAELRRASRDVGFVSVVGHGIPESLFDRVRSSLRALFAFSDEQKQALAIEPRNYRGFIPLGFFTPNRVEANGDRGDQYEGFKLHWECPPGHPAMAECDLYGANRWPAELPELEAVMTEYWAACDRAASPMMDAFADGLGVDPVEFRTWHDAPLTNMTLLHYPAQPPASDAMGIHPHKDTNVITLLHPGDVPGLEVRARSGEWITPDAPSDALVVNVGEMLELWSGGEYVATPHRVVNRSGRERYSFPYFVVPNHRVVVEPLLPRRAGYDTAPMPVGPLSAEVWRTNWPDEAPSTAGHDLGTLDR